MQEQAPINFGFDPIELSRRATVLFCSLHRQSDLSLDDATARYEDYFEVLLLQVKNDDLPLAKAVLTQTSITYKIAALQQALIDSSSHVNLKTAQADLEELKNHTHSEPYLP